MIISHTKLLIISIHLAGYLMSSIKNYFYLVTISLVFLFSFCSEPTESNKSKNIIPFNTGNNWDYLITSYDALGNMLKAQNETSGIFKENMKCFYHLS